MESQDLSCTHDLYWICYKCYYSLVLSIGRPGWAAAACHMCQGKEMKLLRFHSRSCLSRNQHNRADVRVEYLMSVVCFVLPWHVCTSSWNVLQLRTMPSRTSKLKVASNQKWFLTSPYLDQCNSLPASRVTLSLHHGMPSVCTFCSSSLCLPYCLWTVNMPFFSLYILYNCQYLCIFLSFLHFVCTSFLMLSMFIVCVLVFEADDLPLLLLLLL